MPARGSSWNYIAIPRQTGRVGDLNGAWLQDLGKLEKGRSWSPSLSPDIKKDCALSGYRWGSERKRTLLDREKSSVA
jgi:hypothetical protein